MPDPALHGNADPCQACALRRADLPPPDPLAEAPAFIECQLCGGFGRLALPAEEIVRRTVAWNVVHYWPAVRAREAAAARRPP